MDEEANRRNTLKVIECIDLESSSSSRESLRLWNSPSNSDQSLQSSPTPSHNKNSGGTTDRLSSSPSPLPIKCELIRGEIEVEVETSPATSYFSASPCLPCPEESQPQKIRTRSAMDYITKVKDRFQSQPEIYDQFIKVLFEFVNRKPLGNYITEQQLYYTVVKLFTNKNQDLLQGFSEFFSFDIDPSENSGALTESSQKKGISTKSIRLRRHSAEDISANRKESSVLSIASMPTVSKSRSLEELPRGNAAFVNGEHQTELNFFAKVRELLQNDDIYYDFIRCIYLFNENVISGLQLVRLTAPFLTNTPELLPWFKKFVGVNETTNIPPKASKPKGIEGKATAMETVQKKEVAYSENAKVIIDYRKCKRLGSSSSYFTVPSSYKQPKCSGRTPLCDDVLNDVYFCCPKKKGSMLPSFLMSTDITGMSNLEIAITQCEDGRYEMDMLIEMNVAIIKVLDDLSKQMSQMPPVKLALFRLNGTFSDWPCYHTQVINRLYGPLTGQIYDRLAKNPEDMVPVLIRRLKLKNDEWRENQKEFNSIWRSRIENFVIDTEPDASDWEEDSGDENQIANVVTLSKMDPIPRIII